MPVGKAQAATVESAGEEFRFVVPCFTAIDEAKITDLNRDHFFWLDLTAPSHVELARLHELFGFTHSRSRTPNTSASVPSSTTTATMSQAAAWEAVAHHDERPGGGQAT